ncbi:uncharacterized protein yellow-k [Eurosta solidaginis]|uniref:uncharacterized protein yellow-k n=1 Tax=Eurosta solidaginis TaxID=178769 RepID=UPI003530EA5F
MKISVTIQISYSIAFHYFLSILIIESQIHTNSAWDLAQTGLRDPYRVRHLSVQHTRVFLCISTKRESFPSLIATNWPGSFVPLQTVIYPERKAHANGIRSNCELIQKAIWTQVDSLGRLWVLDAGWEDVKSNITHVCPPKLLVYDLLRYDAEVLRIDCSTYLTPKLAESVIVKLGTRTEPCKVEKYLFFLLPDDAHIHAYDIIEQKWHRRALLSRKFHGIIEEQFPIKPIDITFGQQNELLVADADGKLYATANAQLKMKLQNRGNEIINTNELNTQQKYGVPEINNKSNAIELELLGSLLGPSRSMLMEMGTGRLFYVVPKYGAIVRSNYHRNMMAEDNEIIYITSNNIQQIFFGREGAVWLLTDRLLQPKDRCFGNI